MAAETQAVDLPQQHHHSYGPADTCAATYTSSYRPADIYAGTYTSSYRPADTYAANYPKSTNIATGLWTHTLPITPRAPI